MSRKAGSEKLRCSDVHLGEWPVRAVRSRLSCMKSAVDSGQSLQAQNEMPISAEFLIQHTIQLQA